MRRAAIRSIQWVCYAPSPYNNQIFRSIAENLSVPVQFHFTKAASEAHCWGQNLPADFPSRCYERRFGVDWMLVRRVCCDSSNLFVTNCWQDLTSQIIILFLMLLNRPYLIWNDTPSLHRKRTFIKRHLRLAYLKLVFRRAFAVMGTGRPALSALTKMGCPTDKLVNFPYFIDLNEFSSPARSEQSHPIIFGSCGRLHQDKGYDLALRALTIAFRDANVEFRYRLAGTGAEAGTLKSLAEQLGIAARVEFLEWVDPSDLPRFYHSLDFFLHPARSEPYGVSVLEAMATGAIVIASDQTASALDRIIDGVSGFFHISNDSGHMADVIAKAAQLSSCERNCLRLAARLSAESWPTIRGTQILSELLRKLRLQDKSRIYTPPGRTRDVKSRI